MTLGLLVSAEAYSQPFTVRGRYCRLLNQNSAFPASDHIRSASNGNAQLDMRNRKFPKPWVSWHSA